MQIMVRGLDEWRRDMKAIDMIDKVKDAHREIGELVISKAEQKRQQLQSDYRLYRKVTMKPSANQRRVLVTVGPKTFGAMAEFGEFIHWVYGRGMDAGRMKKRVVPAWTGNRYTLTSEQTSGLMVFPTIAENREEIYDEYQKAVDRATERAFPE